MSIRKEKQGTTLIKDVPAEKNLAPVWRVNANGLPQPTYKPAFVNEDKAAGVHIVYAVYDHRSSKYVRYRIKLNRYRQSYKRKNDFLKFAEGIANQINVKLAGGWTPLGETRNARFYTPFGDVIDAYLKDRQGEVRHATYLSYSSAGKVMKDWVEAKLSGCQIIDFNRVHALEFMQYLRDERNVSNRTYNNYLKLARLFFEWSVQHCYCKEDPFKTIKARKKEVKKRVVISQEVRTGILKYLNDKDPAFLIFLELVFFALMRPMEIRRCRISQLHLDDHYIHIPADQAKCWADRNAPLSDELIARIRTYLNMYAHTREDYLFSSYFRPGSSQIGKKAIWKRWEKVRKALELDENQTIYSLRDSGIVDMLHSGVDDLDVMHAAGHHDLSITSVYANHVDPKMIERVRERQVDFADSKLLSE